MESKHLVKTAAVIACAFALAAAIGCSSGGSNESTSAESAATSAAPAATSAAPTADTSASPTAEPGAQTSAALGPEGQQAEPAPADASQVTAENAAELGYQVFEGTIRVCTAEELLKLQGRDDLDPSMVGPGGTYAVLAFDEPTDVVGQSADGSGERTEASDMIGIAEFTDYENFVVEYGDLDACKALDGQHVKLAALTDSIMFPTDVRLPIAEPSAKVVVVLQ